MDSGLSWLEAERRIAIKPPAAWRGRRTPNQDGRSTEGRVHKHRLCERRILRNSSFEVIPPRFVRRLLESTARGSILCLKRLILHRKAPCLRRPIALSLLAWFSWMLILPMFAPDAEANLPPCCRRNGKHHCMMRMMQRPSGHEKRLGTASEKCPYLPVSTCAVYSQTFKPECGEIASIEVVRPVPSAPQQESLRSAFLLRSHQKRGPPAPLV